MGWSAGMTDWTAELNATAPEVEPEAETVQPLKSAVQLPAGIFSAADLQGRVFPPIKWIVPDILPEGLTLLAGKPKLGKSWLALDIAVAALCWAASANPARCYALPWKTTSAACNAACNSWRVPRPGPVIWSSILNGPASPPVWAGCGIGLSPAPARGC
jgi:hypothetical protein